MVTPAVLHTRAAAQCNLLVKRRGPHSQHTQSLNAHKHTASTSTFPIHGVPDTLPLLSSLPHTPPDSVWRGVVPCAASMTKPLLCMPQPSTAPRLGQDGTQSSPQKDVKHRKSPPGMHNSSTDQICFVPLNNTLPDGAATAAQPKASSTPHPSTQSHSSHPRPCMPTCTTNYCQCQPIPCCCLTAFLQSSC